MLHVVVVVSQLHFIFQLGTPLKTRQDKSRQEKIHSKTNTMKFVFATTAALATLALAQKQHQLSVETVSLGVVDGHIVQNFELEANAARDYRKEYYSSGFGICRSPNDDGAAGLNSVQDLKYLYVTQTGVGPICVQVTDGKDEDYVGYYESHSTDRSGCTSRSNDRFGVVLDIRDPHTFRCSDGTATPGTCDGIKIRIRCGDGPSEFNWYATYTTLPLVSSFVPVVSLDALAEQRSLGVASGVLRRVVPHFGGGHMNQTFELMDVFAADGEYLTIHHPDGLFQNVNDLKVTHLSGGPLCVQTTEDAGDLRDWSGYYESHSTDQSGCTNGNNHRFGVALDNWNRTTFRCRDGTAAPGTCRGIKLRVHCYSDCTFQVMFDPTTLPIVSYKSRIEPPTLSPTRSPTNYDDDDEAAELSTAAVSGIVVGCVAEVGLLAGGAYAMKKKQSSEGVKKLLV